MKPDAFIRPHYNGFPPASLAKNCDWHDKICRRFCLVQQREQILEDDRALAGARKILSRMFSIMQLRRFTSATPENL
jgi:hypothetical protein